MAKSQSKLPHIQTLLGDKIPNAAVLDSLILDLDFKLDENTRLIESSVSDLLDTINDLPGMKPVANPCDGLQYIYDHRLLDRSSCYDVDSQQVLSFLKHILAMLEEDPSRSGEIYHQLISFSEREGVCLTLKSTLTDQIADSVLSINTVADNSEQEVAQLWQTISLKLQTFFIDELAKLDNIPIPRIGRYIVNGDTQFTNGTTANNYSSPISYCRPTNSDLNENGDTSHLNKYKPSPKADVLHMYREKRLEYVQGLTRVCSHEAAWKHYVTLRHKQLDTHFAVLCKASEEINVSRVSENCVAIAHSIIEYMDEDFLLFSSTVFTKVKGTLASLAEIYLERFSDEMSLVVEEIHDDLLRLASNKMAQSRSAFGFRASPKHSLAKMRGQAKSIESELKYITNDGSPDHPPIPLSYVGMLAPLVQSFLLIDAHLDTLYNGSAWQVAGVSSRKSRSRSNLRSALKASPSPDLKRRPLAMTEIAKGDNSDSSDLATTANSVRSNSDYEDVRTPRIVERSKTEDRPRWDWRLVFKRIGSEIVTLVDSSIKTGLKACLSDLTNDAHEYEEILVYNKVTGAADVPLRVFKSVNELMMTVNQLLPIAEAGVSGVFAPARTAFVDSLILSLQKLHTQISKICLGVPVSNPLRPVYVSLASSIYIETCLHHYNAILSTDMSAAVLGVSERLYDDLTRSLSAQLVHVHCQLLNNHILFDGASNDWLSNKEFHENERVSLNVQTWGYHLSCIRHDLWSICPGSVSQNVLVSVLDVTLDTLTRRYCKITPTRRRLTQYKGDILSILHIANEMLFCVSQTTTQILDVGHHQRVHVNIHNNCSLLLATMAVISAPLSLVYKIFKKGFANSRSGQDDDRHSDDTSGGYPTQWLSWIQPTLYLPNQTNMADMQTTNAVYLLIKLISEQPTPPYQLILQALTCKEYTLPILLLTSSVPVDNGTPDTSHNALVYDLFSAVFSVMSLEDHYNDAILRLCTPIFDKTGLWDKLNVHDFITTLDQLPVVLRVIFDLMRPFVLRVLSGVLSTLNDPSPPHTDLLSSWGNTLPCGCPCQSPEKAPRSKDGSLTKGKDQTECNMRQIVQNLSDDLDLLPTPLCVLFKALQESIQTNDIRVARSCIGLQLIAGCIRNTLTDFPYVETVTCRELTADSRERLSHLIPHSIYLIAGCIRNTLTDFPYVETVTCRELTADSRERLSHLADSVYVMINGITRASGLTRTASHFRKRNKEWLALKMEGVISYLHSPLFDLPESTPFSEETTEFCSDLMTSTVEHVLNKPTGEKSLHHLHNIIVNNKQWLATHLDVRPALPWLHPLSHKQLDLTPDSHTAPFSHLSVYKAIGDCQFSQSAMLERDLDHADLLLSDLGLTEHSVRSLLLRREDLQDGAQLGDAEAKYARVLRDRFTES